MEPIAETRRAVDDYGPFVEDGDLLEHLQDAALEARALVPSCVGVTLAFVREGLAFTLVSSDIATAALDAVQYLDDGPCVASAREASTVSFEGNDPDDEQRWRRFARATAARGVASTLTLPVLDDDGGSVTGSVNLYAGTAHAFDGHHDAMAEIFGAWAGGAVTNADLDFATLVLSRRTPSLLQDQVRTSRAIGRIMVDKALSLTEADNLIRQAAARAGVDVSVIVDLVLDSADTDL